MYHHIDVIIPGELYLGDINWRDDVHLHPRIGGIVDVSNTTFDEDDEDGDNDDGDDRFEFLTLSIHDRPDNLIRQFFDPTHAFIDRMKAAEKATLVHCYAGISRSSSIVCSYLMKKHAYSLCYALNKLQSCRNVVYPNAGFVRQLMDYEEFLQVTKVVPRKRTFQHMDYVNFCINRVKRRNDCIDEVSLRGFLSSLSIEEIRSHCI